MKTCVKVLFLGVLFTVFCCISLLSYAEGPNPPIVPGEHGTSGNVPVGAPIDSGVIILLFLGAGYSAVKLFSARNEKTEGMVS